MAVDAFKNFAKTTVSTGYDASATSVVLSSGHGARLPTAPFNATWYNSTDYADPSDDPNVEIVRVTAISTDTLTVTRAQEGTSASTKNTSGKTYKIIAGITALSMNALAVALATNCTTEGNGTTQANTSGTGGNQNTASGTSGTSELIFKSQIIIPAYHIVAGKVIRIWAAFEITTSSSPPTSTLRFKLGSANLVSLGAFTLAASLTARNFLLGVTYQGTAAAGSSVSVEGAGPVVQQTSGTAIINTVAQPVTGINTTIDNAVSVSHQWSAATAGNNIILRQLIVEALN